MLPKTRKKKQQQQQHKAKQLSNTIIYSGLPVEMQLLKASKYGQNRLSLLNPLTHKARRQTKMMPSEIGFPMTWTSAAHFSTKNPINKPAMNNRRIAAVFHFVHPVEKDS